MTTTVAADQKPSESVSTEVTRLAVIVASIRTDRFCPVPANWIADQARQRDNIDIDLIDLADYDCPTVLGGNDESAPLPDQVKRLSERVDMADGFVVVTPVYNRSYPASLKNAIDWLYTEWQLKPVGLMSYGGITGGLQSIDALRNVFTEFHSVPLRDSITFANFWEVFDHDGQPVKRELLTQLADGFLDQLTWWAQSLKQARVERPYPFAGSE